MKRIFSFIIMIGFSAIIISSCNKSQSSEEEETAIPVEVVLVELGNVVQSLNYNGDIKAEFEVRVFSKIPDRIEKFFVDEGDYVSKDDPIAQIYAATIEQSVRQAEAGLLAARAQEANIKLEYDRAQRLYGENAMSKQQYDAIETQFEAVKAQLQQAEAGYETAKSTLNDALVKAPISGVIGERYYEAGDMAAPTMPVVSIVQMNRVKIEFDATEQDLGQLAIGQKAEVKVRTFPDRVFTGKIIKISPILDPLTRMAKVEVLIDNQDKKLKPGMYSRVEITTGEIENVIVVPRYATIENTTLENIDGKNTVVKNYYVFVVDSSKAEQRKLAVQYVNHEKIAVESGLEIGESLVTSGINHLRDGIPVSITTKESDTL